jgi:hypothetical protein
MKVITLEIHDDYAEILTFTAIGRKGTMLNATTHALDMRETNKVIIDKNGKATDVKGE